MGTFAFKKGNMNSVVSLHADKICRYAVELRSVDKAIIEHFFVFESQASGFSSWRARYAIVLSLNNVLNK